MQWPIMSTVFGIIVLQRLALSIPNLVEISPTQSSDGLLYAGMCAIV